LYHYWFTLDYDGVSPCTTTGSPWTRRHHWLASSPCAHAIIRAGQSRCHSGHCYPCTLTQPVSCFCGTTLKSVPCGMERTARPPRCHEPCGHPPACRHSARTPHRCHFDRCLPCELPASRFRLVGWFCSSYLAPHGWLLFYLSVSPVWQRLGNGLATAWHRLGIGWQVAVVAEEWSMTALIFTCFR
jgi:hypothetical protein